MIIKKLFLTNFGKFHEKEIEFQGGLNLIYGENEAGKSTIHTFIRGMFFGIEKQRGRAAANDTYQKYLPWEHPESYEGSMELEWNGKEYRVFRSFHKDNKQFQAWNLTDGRTIDEDEWKALFRGVNESFYDNTMSIGQLGAATDKQFAGIVKNYGANLSSTKSAEMNVVVAIEELQKKRRAEKAKIRGENRQDLVNQSVDLEYGIHTNQTEQMKLSVLENRYEDERRKEEEILEDLREKEMGQQEEQAKIHTKIDGLEENIQEMEQEVEQVKKQIISQKTEYFNIQEKMKKRWNLKEIPSLEQADERMMEQSLETVVPWNFAIALVIEIILVLLFTFLKNYYFVALVALAIFATIGIFLSRMSQQKKQKHMNLEECQTIRESAKEAHQIQEAIDRNKEKISELREKILKMDQEKLEFRKNCKDGNSYREQIELLQQKIKDYRNKINDTTWKLSRLQESEKEMEEEMADIKERIRFVDQVAKEIEAIDMAIQTMDAVSYEIRGSFGRKLNEKTSKYFARFTNGKYQRVFLDEECKLYVESNQKMISVEQLSKGTMEQLYGALRFATIDVMLAKKMPLILDDALAHYDEKRMDQTVRFLQEECAQVLMFSCHTREKSFLEKAKIPYHMVQLS